MELQPFPRDRVSGKRQCPQLTLICVEAKGFVIAPGLTPARAEHQPRTRHRGSDRSHGMAMPHGHSGSGDYPQPWQPQHPNPVPASTSPPSFLFFGCNMPFVLFLQSHHPRLTFGQHHSAFLPLEISSLVQVQSFPRMQSKVSCSFSGQLWSTQSPEGHKALSCGGLTPLV